MNDRHKLLSLQTSQLRPMEINGRRIMSGIFKEAVNGRIEVGRLGLAGDEQADPDVHGGLDKAVYAYPVEHYPYWRTLARENGNSPVLPFGFLGENLTISGLLEDQVYVGDRLRFSDCLLRITRPREPCYKFNARMNDRLAGKKMAQTGYCGFYLAVEQPGSIEAGESFEFEPGPQQTAISELFRIAMHKSRND